MTMVALTVMVAGLTVIGGAGVVGVIGVVGLCVVGVMGALGATGVIMTMRVGTLACHMAYRGTPIRLRLLP